MTASLNIGLTYDLRADYLAAGFGDEETAEFDQAGTINAIEGALGELGHRVDRIGHVRALARRLVDGHRWDLVFNVCEGLDGFGREAQVPALLDAYGIPCTFADPLGAALTLHKGLAKRVLRDCGVPTTPFSLVERPEDVDAVDLGFPLFVKPVAEGTAKGIDGRSRVDDRAELVARCAVVLETFHQAAIVEPYLPGREVTVGILGTGDQARAVGTLEVKLLADADPHSYTYRNKEECEVLCEFALADAALAVEVEPLALAAWRALLGRDGGRVDLRLDAEGRPQVLEVNPLPGMHPSHSDLPMLCTAVGMGYMQLVEAVVDSAARRIGEPRRAARFEA